MIERIANQEELEHPGLERFFSKKKDTKQHTTRIGMAGRNEEESEQS